MRRIVDKIVWQFRESPRCIIRLIRKKVAAKRHSARLRPLPPWFNPFGLAHFVRRVRRAVTVRPYAFAYPDTRAVPVPGTTKPNTQGLWTHTNIRFRHNYEKTPPFRLPFRPIGMDMAVIFPATNPSRKWYRPVCRVVALWAEAWRSIPHLWAAQARC